ncbi:molybdate ABC transporter substrate-binding protein [Teredinibacter haidensis]|uniref:molybdate ABC transporter substrate-binding protein n=1 Tax=Teredinibacter haidensis TaxID=2731755 RepID=UPI000948DAB6|nr:molybdate ABC transporter substrate-binding protein [Teredinibacter haidensis]
MRNICSLLIITYTLFISAGAYAETARIAVAANFYSTLKSLVENFEQQHPHKLVIVSGSTGKLFAQIQNGAPFHAFLSADSLRPEKLLISGHAVPNSDFSYARGRLVYWEPKKAANSTPPKFQAKQKIALANPKIAPYGKAATFALKKLNTQKTKYTTVYGNSVTQTMQFIASGSVSSGFIAMSQILQVPENKRGYWWQVPEDLYPPLHQKAVLLKKGEDNKAAIALLHYLQSREATALISQMGYATDTPQND